MILCFQWRIYYFFRSQNNFLCYFFINRKNIRINSESHAINIAVQHILAAKGEAERGKRRKEREIGKERKGGKARDIKIRAPPTPISANRARFIEIAALGYDLFRKASACEYIHIYNKGVRRFTTTHSKIK